MLMTLGREYFEARSGRNIPVVLDTSKTINGHLLIIGSSGVGKSHTIRRLIADAQRSDKRVRFHVMDVHGDLDIPGASEVQFSEQAPFGLNPLIVNPDPVFGGVRRQIQTFLRILDQASSTAMGVKQESVMRNLLLDVYRDFGFDAEDSRTWGMNEWDSCLVSAGADNRLYLVVPMEEKEQAKALGARWENSLKLWYVQAHTYKGDLLRWKPAVRPRRYPTIADVCAYASRLHEERFLGTDQRGVEALAHLNKLARSLQRKALENVRNHNLHIVDEDAETALELAGQKALAAYEAYVKQMRTGLELETLMKYDSSDVLKSVLDRLYNLRATGLFKDVRPPFDEGVSVWRYKLNALLLEEKKMMVYFLMTDLFYAAVQRGEQKDVVDVVVLDELGTYAVAQDDNGDGIIGTVAREARKFGMALWAANQSPAGVPESLISSVGTKIVLGLDEGYWDQAVKKLRIEMKQLKWIQPHHTMAAQLKEKGAAKSTWRWIQL